MVLSNVVFNYILIFGKFGFPQLGIAGAAIGSSLAEMVSVIFFIIYTWKRIDCKKYALNILPKFQGKTLKRILNVSVWTMIQNFVSLSTWFMFFLFVEHLGERSLESNAPGLLPSIYLHRISNNKTRCFSWHVRQTHLYPIQRKLILSI